MQSHLNAEHTSDLPLETAPEEIVSAEYEELEEEQVDLSIVQLDSQEESIEDVSEVLE